jgi:integrase
VAAGPELLPEGLEAQVTGKAPDDLVFPSPRDGYWGWRTSGAAASDRVATSIGWSGCYPHELRHTAASLAIALRGVDQGGPADARARRRHPDALDRYGHLFLDELDTVADRLDQARADSLCGLRLPRGQ